jgi:hypothetical protein
MDPEDVRERCLVDCDELMERHARGVPPALAAAEYCAGRWDFDFDTWRERHMPSLETVSEQHGCISP